MSDDRGFVHHNIVLSNGDQTLPSEPVLADGEYSRAALRIAKLVCPPVGQRRPRVVDLGCLDGGYAVEFARAGYHAVGLEARASNVERCDFVRDDLELPNLSFVCDDARNLEAHGPFDIVCCFGLLYHLDRPVEFLRMIGRMKPKLLIVRSHYAQATPSTASANYGLSEITEHEGVPGRWYNEPAFADREAMEASSLSSWNNDRSFWILKPYLLALLREIGFPIVYEQFDHLASIEDFPAVAERDSFGSFVGIRA